MVFTSFKRDYVYASQSCSDDKDIPVKESFFDSSCCSRHVYYITSGKQMSEELTLVQLWKLNTKMLYTRPSGTVNKLVIPEWIYQIPLFCRTAKVQILLASDALTKYFLLPSPVQRCAVIS